MLSTIANAAKSTQNYLKLPKTTKICPKIISSRNFEIPPKIEILVYFKKKLPCVERAPKHEYTIWIFNLRIFHMPFSMSKNGLCM
jgi:hypothetical protein